MDRQFSDIKFANSPKTASCRLLLHIAITTPHHIIDGPHLTITMAQYYEYGIAYRLQYIAIGNQPAYITTANSRRFTYEYNEALDILFSFLVDVGDVGAQ